MLAVAPGVARLELGLLRMAGARPLGARPRRRRSRRSTRSRGTYGSPRVHAELRLGRDVRCGRKRVARLMRTAGLQGAFRRRGRRRYPPPPVHDDLVQRRFYADAPDRLWVTDITEHPTREGTTWRRCSRGSSGRSPTTCARSSSRRGRWHAGGAGRLAARPWCTQPREPVPSWAFGRRLRAAGLLGSMGRLGLRQRDDGVVLRDDSSSCERRAATAIFEWIEGWYNPRRRHSSVADLSPVDFATGRRLISSHELSGEPGSSPTVSHDRCIAR